MLRHRLVRSLTLLCCLLLICDGTASLAQEPVTVSYGDVAWSPDGTRLSFTEFRNTGQRMSLASLKIDIYVVKADGTDLKKITGADRNAAGPAWSKDGKRILFGASPVGSMDGREIFSVNADGTGLLQLTHSGNNNSPSISPDGTRVVFNCGGGRKPQICAMNADGTNVAPLTNDTTLGFFNPQWSPAGNTIAYYVEKGDQHDQIWTMNADGSGQKLLTNNVGHNYYPSWSPDGKLLIFTSNRDTATSLYVMNASDGSDLRRLPINGSNARYSPDGTRLAAIVGGRTDSKIVVSDASGGNPVTIVPR
jgi:TolB protein